MSARIAEAEMEFLHLSLEVGLVANAADNYGAEDIVPGQEGNRKRHHAEEEQAEQPLQNALELHVR